MRNSAVALPFLLLPAFGAVFCLAQQAPPQQQPLKAAALESHEGLTISAQPWTDPSLYKAKFPKKSPYAAGILAIEVWFRNDSDDSISVNLETLRLNIKLSDDNRQELRALSPGEVADAVLHPGAKDPTARRVPLPVPIPRSNGGHDKHWKALEQQARDAGVTGDIVAPHKTVQGLLYFDLESQFDLLDGARLYIPDLHVLEKNRSLTYFEIDLSH